MLLVDNSVLKMYLLKSQLSLKIKSVTVIFVLFVYLADKNHLLEVYDCLSGWYGDVGLIWKMSCINFYINIHIIYLSINYIYTCITILHIIKYIHFVFVDWRRNMQFLITAIFAVILLVAVASSCPNVCSCSNHSVGVNVDCSNRGLYSIPTDLPNNTYDL